MDRAKYKEAIFWYECAMKVPMNETSGAFIREDCYGYIPAIQLCVCWWRLGDKDCLLYTSRGSRCIGTVKQAELCNDAFALSVGICGLYRIA